MLRLSWTENKSNDKELREAGVQHTMKKTFHQQQFAFLGHTMSWSGNFFGARRIKGKRAKRCQR